MIKIKNKKLKESPVIDTLNTEDEYIPLEDTVIDADGLFSEGCEKAKAESLEHPADEYEANGYADRDEYLMSLADEYGVPETVVRNMAMILGKSEDFDMLVSEVEDYAESHMDDQDEDEDKDIFVVMHKLSPEDTYDYNLPEGTYVVFDIDSGSAIDIKQDLSDEEDFHLFKTTEKEWENFVVTDHEAFVQMHKSGTIPNFLRNKEI